MGDRVGFGDSVEACPRQLWAPALDYQAFHHVPPATAGTTIRYTYIYIYASDIHHLYNHICMHIYIYIYSHHQRTGDGAHATRTRTTRAPALDYQAFHHVPPATPGATVRIYVYRPRCPRIYTLHPTPRTPHPTPYTLHPTPYTLHPAPCTLHPEP